MNILNNYLINSIYVTKTEMNKLLSFYEIVQNIVRINLCIQKVNTSINIGCII